MNQYKDTQRLQGKGHLQRGTEKIVEVHYDILIHQGYEESEQTLEGTISTEDPNDLSSLVSSGHIYTLHLDDGKKLDVNVVDHRGAIDPVSWFY